MLPSFRRRDFTVVGPVDSNGTSMARVTLKQIADTVGLSTFAVSRALAGKDGVSPATRRLVSGAAERLGYARARVAAGPREIAVVFHDLDPVNDELSIQIQSGVQREAQRLGRPVRLLWSHRGEDVLAAARASEGLLLAGPHPRATIEALRAAEVPVVRLGWVDPLEAVDQVVGTDHEAGQAVAQHLIDLGHREIAFVQGTPGYRGRMERFYGAREVAERWPGVTLHPLAFDEPAGFGAAFAAMRTGGIPPTACFCAHDGLALTVVSHLLSLGLRIPEDISVVGFGDFAAATQISPALTTVRVEGTEIGAVGLRLLVERIDAGDGGPARRVQIVSRLVARQSSGPCPVVALSVGGQPRERA